MRELYKILSVIGDLMAMGKGTYHKRFVRKKAHKFTAKTMRKFLK